jgi:uracil-DNA glycosylase family protein
MKTAKTNRSFCALAAAGSPPLEMDSAGRDFRLLARDAAACKRCELWKSGTQTVFGEGPVPARLMLVGEQPGDKEDLAGRPFVGPAGRVLDEALETAGVDRKSVYVTNAVKHFRWKERGKRRIHEKPKREHVTACKPWLEDEVALVRPEVIVCLGSTAAQSLLGASFRVTQDRGKFFASELSDKTLATIHPSAILRLRSAPEREHELAALAADLHFAATATPLVA